MTSTLPGRVGTWLRAAALVVGAWSGALYAAGTEVIVSPDRAAYAVDRPMLRAIFTVRLREWPDGVPIRVFVLPDDNGIHDQFCREQLGMYPYVLRDIWDRLQFTGTGLIPTVVRSEPEMRSRVLSTPGAIGYVSSTNPQNLSDATHLDRNKQDGLHGGERTTP